MHSMEELEYKKKCRTLYSQATDPIEKIRYAVMARTGTGGMKMLGKRFIIMDDDRSKSLNWEEFHKGMREIGISESDISDETLKEAFQVYDVDGSGTISYNEFLKHVRPPMPDCRVQLIEKAYKKMDKTGDGKITVDDMIGVYNAKTHPKYKSGEWSEKRVFLEFLTTFDDPDPDKRDGVVTGEEFYNYYSGVSDSIDDNAYFNLMMTNSWKI